MEGQLKTFTVAIDDIQRQMLKMGELVNREMNLAVESIFSEKKDIENEVIQIDKKVDDFDNKIQSSILQLITIQPPFPRELEVLTTMIRISRELERIGDHSVNIVEISQFIKVNKASQLYIVFREMSGLTSKMLEESIQMLRKSSNDQEQLIMEKEEEVDRYFDANQKFIVAEMRRDNEQIESLVHLLMVNRYLERGADHIVNVVRLHEKSND
ncbi:phosphate transport system regulatory protein PhoU [Salipaludibacillus neizhouensis]|uniref:Phosphate transport system regulatory protein PhoU n=1 Tax=Salipaludibacillus neizhouensis TaxID=885475 RepID=A0A3A9K3X8_9BACI|nr:phosphate signaling complex protein PhoU [Salipaludibacillus neizhouensis]RKL65001.1 phosphate transport system regulatory protein PhoU [Salipaludibacillus neizhouensis]